MAEHQPSPDKSMEMLSMENELLRFEVSFLRGKLAKQSQLEEEERARLQLAYKDLVLLVNRISKSPIGPLMRKRPSFRKLESRYRK